jgi:hypothetical protein
VTELDTRLMRAFAADAPAATDPLFRVQVILRRQRAALRRQLAEALGFACVSAVLAVLVLQALDEVVKSSGVRLVVTAILAMGYVVVFTRRYLGVPLFVYLLGARVRSLVWGSRDGS